MSVYSVYIAYWRQLGGHAVDLSNTWTEVLLISFQTRVGAI